MTAETFDWLYGQEDRPPIVPEEKPDGVFFGTYLAQYQGEDVEIAVYARPAPANQLASIEVGASQPPQRTQLPTSQPERRQVNAVDAAKAHMRAVKRLSGWLALTACLNVATTGISHQNLLELGADAVIHPVQTAENVMAIPTGIVEAVKSAIDGAQKVASLGGKLG